MRVPDIDLVRCFVTVVESGGFTQASKRLHLTPSVITSNAMRGLIIVSDRRSMTASTMVEETRMA
jgi:hypothetical protein